MVGFILEIFREENGFKKIYFKQKPQFKIEISNSNQSLFIWGDPILNNSHINFEDTGQTLSNILNGLSGHFYYVFQNNIENKIYIGNSFLSILPIYYIEENDKLVVSDNAIKIAEILEIKKVSKKFILETVLFNYPLFSESIIDGVSLLPCNHIIIVENNLVAIKQHTEISEFFIENPIKWRRSANSISDKFLVYSEKYFPQEHYVNSLTGGFDGRTLVAVGHYYKKDFSCYSFGSTVSNDVKIAKHIANFTKLEFETIHLDEEYIKNHSLSNGLEFIYNSSGISTFARAHYLYAAKQIGKSDQVIVTGNFGSEVFRALHIAGVVFSPNLYKVFSSKTVDEAYDKIIQSDEFVYLNSKNFEKEIKELKYELAKLPCFNLKYNRLSLNKKFYIYVFEEVFRKYFGSEMINQYYYLSNRTPFIDKEFLKEIFKTNFAGIHSNYFENNPFKRFKGQILYAYIIKKAFPSLGKIKTDKGYSPNDLLNIVGNFKIIFNFFIKKIKNIKEDYDPQGVKRAFVNNRIFFEGIEFNQEYFDSKTIHEKINKNIDETLFKPISLNYIVNHINTKLSK